MTSEQHPDSPTGTEYVLRGMSICPGVGIGRVHLVDPELPVSERELTAPQAKAEKQRYATAVRTTRRRLRDHINTVHGTPPPEISGILDVHRAMLNDESFHERVRQCIAAKRRNAEWCVWQQAGDLIDRFAAMRDPYFAARGEDVRDMAHNLIGVLSQGMGKIDRSPEQAGVFVSRHLHSSDAILAERSRGEAFASESQALVSHAAILLKGFGIPAIGKVEHLTEHAQEGDLVIVDGTNGLVVIRPSPQTLETYRRQVAADAHPHVQGTTGSIKAAGEPIDLRANLENPNQVGLLDTYGLNGIGLFRTEFMISQEGQIPNETEQYDAYRTVITAAKQKPVVIRTFDIGGDKHMGLLACCAGRNPALGLRGIRRHLVDRTDELHTQLRAILRAAIDANVGILIPMVTTTEDVIQTKRHLDTTKETLRQDHIPFSETIELGAMIETPAAAIAVREILAEVAFVSIGTNDLLQYFTATDRDNEKVIHYQDATSPAFLWLMRYIIEEAEKHGRSGDVTVCGEMAADVRVFPHLIRMGYRRFSVTPVSATAFRRTCTALWPERKQPTQGC